MLDCPRCHQPVKPNAITCPYCRTPLKAHGHPGIPLHRATGTEPLCKTCIYNADDSCTYPQRPYARECTMYHDRLIPIVSTPTKYESSSAVLSPDWLRRHSVWLVLAGLILFSFWLASSRR